MTSNNTHTSFRTISHQRVPGMTFVEWLWGCPQGVRQNPWFFFFWKRKVHSWECSVEVLARAEGIVTLFSQPECTMTSPWGAPTGQSAKSRLAPLCYAQQKALTPRGAPLGHPRGHSSYHAGRTHSRRFATGWFSQSLVKPSYAQDWASGQVYFYNFANSDPRQSHVCKVTFGTGCWEVNYEIIPPPMVSEGVGGHRAKWSFGRWNPTKGVRSEKQGLSPTGFWEPFAATDLRAEKSPDISIGTSCIARTFYFCWN